MQFGVRRLVILVVVGLAIGGVFGFFRARSGSDSQSSGVPPTLFDVVVPGLCAMEGQLASNKRAEASNTFWSDVHLPAHELAAELVPLDRRAAERFQRAKLAVETDLSTLAPALKKSVDAFETEARSALALVGRPGAAPCG